MPEPELHIVCGPPRPAEALELVFADVPWPERRRRTAEALAELTGGAGADGGASREWLLAAYRGERLVGAAWAQPREAGEALVYPPHLRTGEDAATGDRLLAALEDRLARRGLRLFQAILPPAPAGRPDPQGERLAQAGYVLAAQLRYFTCERDGFPRLAPLSDLDLSPTRGRALDELERLLARTFVDSPDCAPLEGLRSAAESLASYRATGDGGDALWRVLQRHGRDVGLLLLANHAALAAWEIVYLGLVASERRQGLGGAAVRWALWQAGQAERERVLVAADTANEGAMALYEKGGFLAWDERRAFVKKAALREPGSAAEPPGTESAVDS